MNYELILIEDELQYNDSSSSNLWINTPNSTNDAMNMDIFTSEKKKHQELFKNNHKPVKCINSCSHYRISFNQSSIQNLDSSFKWSYWRNFCNLQNGIVCLIWLQFSAKEHLSIPRKIIYWWYSTRSKISYLIDSLESWINSL